jgi:hypothetical protein
VVSGLVVPSGQGIHIPQLHQLFAGQPIGQASAEHKVAEDL